MLYTVAIEPATETTSYGIVFPDVIGCFSSGKTLEKALENAKEALDLHLTGLAEDGQLPPEPKPMEAWIHDPEFDGWSWGIIEIDVTPYMGKSKKINVTLPNLMVKKIDDFVKENPNYRDRSSFLQIAAMNEMKAAE